MFTTFIVERNLSGNFRDPNTGNNNNFPVVYWAFYAGDLEAMCM